ncbi:MFS general substrate transporter [Lindgomyces ingoldianus]|uniref:MFS general substrate transporter n=1 Tax=Lindgomyces ingoldianus TaxID=673940 RepID=A0ACB6QEN3_9PLEO|nr:MFS general substrate transporter [Lindgomyces ingoldianus]KAF2465362.1 MFS general substrate transporter [Lindgomyces ingoldianus]
MRLPVSASASRLAFSSPSTSNPRSAPEEPPDHGSPHDYPPRNHSFHIAFPSICTCTFVATIDTVIVATALPAITTSLHAISHEAYWCGTGFLFAQTVSQPLYGAVQEVVGHKRTMLGALGVFWGMSVLCATARDVGWLAQGLGGGGINAMVNALVLDMVPLHERGTYAAPVNLAGAVGLVSGVVLGAAFAEKSTWRLCVSSFATNLLYKPPHLLPHWPRPHPLPPHPRLRLSLLKIDYLGAIFLTSTLISLLYGVTNGSALYAWSHSRIISALIIVLWGLAYYLILYFLIARGHSLLHSAVEILPGIATIPFSWVSLSVGIGLLALLTPDTSLGETYGYRIVLAIGGGIVFPGQILAVQVCWRDEDEAIATTMVSFFTSLGEAFGVGIGGSIFQNRWERLVQRYVRTEALKSEFVIGSRAAEGPVERIKGLPSEVQEVYREVMAGSLRTLWITFAVLSAVRSFVSLAQRNLSLGEKKDEKWNIL